MLSSVKVKKGLRVTYTFSEGVLSGPIDMENTFFLITAFDLIPITHTFQTVPSYTL